MNYTFSFQRVSLTKCRNLTAKKVDFDAWRRQVSQFAVATARPRLGTWSIITWPVGGKKLLTFQTMPRTSAGQVRFVATIVLSALITRRDGESPPKLKKITRALAKVFSPQQRCWQLWIGLRWPKNFEGGKEETSRRSFIPLYQCGNLSNRSPGVQIPCDNCTRFGRYLFSTKCKIIEHINERSQQTRIYFSFYAFYALHCTKKFTLYLFDINIPPHSVS